MPGLSPQVEAVRARLMVDTPFWAGGVVWDESAGEYVAPSERSVYKGCAKVLDERKRLVPLVGRPWQLEFDAAIERQRVAGLPQRAIILKARKLGFSTWVVAKVLQRVTQVPYQNAVLIAQDVKTAGVLFEMARLMYSHLPTEEELGLGFNIKPGLVGASFAPNGRKFMQFGERIRALRAQGRGLSTLLEIDTANTPESGRGYTPSQMHCSEVAWWANPSKLVGALNSVPDVEDTLIVLESTANGFNHFHKRWELAEQGVADEELGGGAFLPLFFGWWRNPSNARAFTSPEARDRFVEQIGTGPYGEEEPYLVEVFGCSPEQLLWRRVTIRDKCEDSIEVFHQEHPATPEEAFIGSGNPVFSQLLVTKAIKRADESPEPVHGWLEGADFEEKRTRGGTILVPRRAIWVPGDEVFDRKDLIAVWEHPVLEQEQERAGVPEEDRRPDGRYVAFADVAQGEGNTFEEGDWHAVQVFDHDSREQVARYRSRIDLDELPLVLLLIALYWNEALLAIEVNGPGIAPTEKVQKDYRYRRMYRRRRHANVRNEEDVKIGWATTQVTKPLMETSMGLALRDETHGLRCRLTARELTTYISDDRGRHGAMQGAHDDLLISAMGAHRVMDEVRPRPRPGERSGRRGRLPSDDLTGY